MADPIDAALTNANKIILSAGGATDTSYDIKDAASYLSSLSNWLKVLMLKSGLDSSWADDVYLKAATTLEAFKKYNYGMSISDFLKTMPYFTVMTSKEDIDRDLEIYNTKNYVNDYNKTVKDLTAQAKADAEEKAKQDYLNNATIGQAKADQANTENQAKDIIKNVQFYSTDDLNKLLPTVIGTPRTAIENELRNRGQLSISDYAKKTTFTNVTKEQYDAAVAKVKSSNGRDADALYIKSTYDMKQQIDWAKNLLDKEPNNPAALQVLQDAQKSVEGVPGALSPEQQKQLDNYISPEVRAKMISEFKVPDQPELPIAYNAFLDKLEPNTSVKNYYKEDISDVYKKFQTTEVNGKTGDALRAEWWQTLSWANAGLLDQNAPVFSNAAIEGWAKDKGLTVEKYLETAQDYVNNPNKNDIQWGVGITEEDKKKLQTAGEYKSAFDIQGRQANQDYLAKIRSTKDPWIDFLDKYDWGASPSQRGFYPSTLAPMASWRR
jgi:hypothetical protein